jgi:hypothetical protein
VTHRACFGEANLRAAQVKGAAAPGRSQQRLDALFARKK